MVMPDLQDVPKPVYEDLKVVSREKWKALPPKESEGVDESLKTPAQYVVLMHTATKACKKKDDCLREVQEMQKKDMEERGLSDIQYNFIIGGDARIYEGRGYTRKPPENSKCPELYDNCVEIMFIGDYQKKHIPEKVTEPAYDLIQILRDMGILHHDFKIERLLKFKKAPEQSIKDMYPDEAPPPD